VRVDGELDMRLLTLIGGYMSLHEIGGPLKSRMVAFRGWRAGGAGTLAECWL